jgi:hypothetical protein
MTGFRGCTWTCEGCGVPVVARGRTAPPRHRFCVRCTVLQELPISAAEVVALTQFVRAPQHIRRRDTTPP